MVHTCRCHIVIMCEESLHLNSKRGLHGSHTVRMRREGGGGGAALLQVFRCASPGPSHFGALLSASAQGAEPKVITSSSTCSAGDRYGIIIRPSTSR